jgi:hypothetical protein
LLIIQKLFLFVFLKSFDDAKVRVSFKLHDKFSAFVYFVYANMIYINFTDFFSKCAALFAGKQYKSKGKCSELAVCSEYSAFFGAFHQTLYLCSRLWERGRLRPHRWRAWAPAFPGKQR